MAGWWSEKTARGAFGGALGGLVGVWLYFFYAVLLQVAHGRAAWPALKLFAVPLLPAAATSQGFDAMAVAVGFAVPMALAAVCGALFGLLTHRLPAETLLPIGAVTGVLVWVAGAAAWQALPAGWTLHAGAVLPDWAAMIQLLMIGLFIGAGTAIGVLPRGEWRGLGSGRFLLR